MACSLDHCCRKREVSLESDLLLMNNDKKDRPLQEALSETSYVGSTSDYLLGIEIRAAHHIEVDHDCHGLDCLSELSVYRFSCLVLRA